MAEKSNKECCICGDIGFCNDLRLCPNCGFRLQHTYCSSSYPNIDMQTWLCEWCLHDQSKKQQPNNKRGKALDFLLKIAQSLPQEETDMNGGDERRSKRRREEEKRTRSGPNPKKNRALERWRKPSCISSSSPRGMGRRYKLLADVMC